MGVTIPSKQTGLVISEFAANTSTTTRQIQSIGGVIVPVFSGSMGYQRTDYLVDGSGQRIGVIQSEMGGIADPARYGQVYLDAKAFADHLTADPALAAAFQKIADFEDSLVKADLVNRNIIPA